MWISTYNGLMPNQWFSYKNSTNIITDYNYQQFSVYYISYKYTTDVL